MAMTEVGLRISLKDRKVAARQLKDTKDDIDRVGDAATKSGRKAASASSGGWKRFSGMLGRLTKLGLVGVTAVGAIGVAGATAGLKTAASMEQANISFTTMLGSAQKAQVFIGKLAKFAADTPFDFPGLQTAASSLVSAGIDANKVIPIMTTLGDVTSGMGTGAQGIQRATVALQQMNAAQKISGEDLNQLRDAGIPVYDLLAAALHKTKGEVVQLAQKGKLGQSALSKMMKALETGKGLERFNGLMAKQSQSLSGVWSTLQDTINMGLAKAMQPMLPMVKKLVLGASDLSAKAFPLIQRGVGWISRSVAGAAHALESGGVGTKIVGVFHQVEGVVSNLITVGQHVVPVFAPLAVMVGTTLVAALILAWHAVQQLSAVLVPVGNWIGSHKTLVQTLAVVVLTAVAAWKAWTIATKTWTAITKAAAKVQAAFNVVMDANPIMLVVVGLAALAAGLIYAYKHSEAFRNVVQGVFGWLKSSATSVWHFMQKWGPLILTAVAPVIGLPLLIWQHWSQITGFVARAWNGAIGFLRGVPGMILKVFVGAHLWLYHIGGKIVGGLFRGIKSAFGKGISFASGIAKSIANGVIGFINGKIIDPLKDFRFTIGALGFHHTFQPFGSLPEIAEFREGGGPVAAGRPYVVGERRPELFVPDVDGTILPRVPSMPAVSAPSLADFDLDDADITVGTGLGGDIYLTVELDGKVVYQVVVEKQKKTVARQ